MPTRVVLSVGQCAADHGAISRMILQHFDAKVESADSVEEALDRLRRKPADLVLVNRLMDQSGVPGLDLVKEIKADAALKETPVMLVSNYEEAQLEAMGAGALRGFGKNALEHPQTTARLRGLLE